MRYMAGVALACFACVSSQAADTQKILTIEADDWCPINCPPNQQPLGISIEIAKKIFEPLGYRINYVIVSWDRALKDVRSGKADAVVGANTSDDPNLVFPQMAITNISDDFFVLKGNPWRYQGDYTLKGKKMGVIADYGYGEVIRKYIEANKNERGMIVFASGEEAIRKNIMNLIDGKIHVAVESKLVMDHWLKKLNLQSKVEWVGGIPQGNVYMAFSPALASSKELARQYDEGIKRLKSSQELFSMYRAYGITPP